MPRASTITPATAIRTTPPTAAAAVAQEPAPHPAITAMGAASAAWIRMTKWASSCR